MADNWLKLIRLHGLGPAGVVKLLDYFNDPESALQATSREWRQAGLSEAQATLIEHSLPDVSDDLSWLEQPDNHLVTLHDPRYPAALRDIHTAPAALFVKGNPDILSHPQLAMVGSRNPTRNGLQLAEAFADHFAAAGLAITSGLALGIDAASHRGALNQTGLTIAVTGTGPDRIYPARHKNLAARIIEKGAIVTEFPVGTQAKPENFPRRNRIISGLSLGTLVIEAAQKSGSLISARFAAEQGREVFAIPGSIHNPMARGCHQLIREGAKLVETAQDVLDELSPHLSRLTQTTVNANVPESAEALELDQSQRELLAHIPYDPTPIDHIIEHSGLTPESVSSMLLILELNNFVISEPGGYYLRVKGEQ